MVKVTFTLDDETVRTLRQSAQRLRKPQSAVVREAIADYADRVGQLTARERAHMLKTLDAIVGQPPTRPQVDVAAELREIRASRRATGPRRARIGR